MNKNIRGLCVLLVSVGIAVLCIAAFVSWVVWYDYADEHRSYAQQRQEAEQPIEFTRIQIGEAEFTVEIADSPDEWKQGLQYREELQEDTGMVFEFQEKEVQTFWMKNTLIPLDMVWVENDRVVGFTEFVQPEPGVPDEQLQKYSSPEPVTRVIEVPAGTVQKYRISVGDTVVRQAE